jgi:hypothetical protein
MGTPIVFILWTDIYRSTVHRPNCCITMATVVMWTRRSIYVVRTLSIFCVYF